MFTPPVFDVSAEIQNLTEYFYPLSFKFNADFQKINAEIPLLPLNWSTGARQSL